MDRRKFLSIMGLTGAAAAVPWAFDLKAFRFMAARAYPFAQSPTNIRKFVTALPGLGNAGIPLATAATQLFAGQLTDVYRITAKEYTQQLHPDLPGPTHLRGYTDNASGISRYLGGVIVANRNRPVLLYVTNGLTDKALVPTDPTIMAGPNGLMVGNLPLNRTATHLHGGFTPWFSDGTPFQWFDPLGATGASFMNVPGTNPFTGTQTNYYPNDQGARLAWYHDHAIGITRINAYTGIASGYIITDQLESLLIKKGVLPDLGTPLIIQDKSFVPQNLNDPNWVWGGPGDLWYPYLYEGPGLPNPPGTSTIPDFSTNPFGPGTARWDYGPNSDQPMKPPALGLPKASIVPEFFSDTTMVNGMPYPFLNVTDKRFRFRVLNGSQARFWHLNLYVEDSNHPGELLIVHGKPVKGPTMFQIGTEGGFLPAVVKLPNGIPLPIMPDGAYPASSANPAGPFNLLLAPAERADLLIDFKGWAGTKLLLFNDAVAPFPMGDARNEYFTGDLDMTAFGGAPPTQLGKGPNTQTIMRIVVGAGSKDDVKTSTVLDELNSALEEAFENGEQPKLLYRHGEPSTPGPIPIPDPPKLFAGAVKRRQLTLNEDFDEYGRLRQRLGTTTQNGSNNQGERNWGRDYLAATTETPKAGDIEIWDIWNLTGDTHPIHFHLVNVQVVQRAAFDAETPTFKIIRKTQRGPDANELGWKETVRMNPGEVTTVIMQFNLPDLPTAAMRHATSPRTGGHEYVWHCHILEHEEHDMMRPLVVM